MKWLLVTVLLLFQVGIVAAYEPPAGFRGLQWGTDIATVKKEMVLIESDGDEKIYSRKKDKLKIGEAKVSEISYGFYKGRLHNVMIIFSGYSNFSKLKQTLIETYGESYQDNEFMERYWWGMGSPVVISLKYSDVSNQGLIIYRQKEISGQQEEDEKKKSRDAEKDL